MIDAANMTHYALQRLRRRSSSPHNQWINEGDVMPVRKRQEWMPVDSYPYRDRAEVEMREYIGTHPGAIMRIHEEEW